VLPITPLTPADRDEVRRFIEGRWGADYVVAHGIPLRNELELEQAL